ncbi:MAG: hypothetical protein PHO63_05390 [Bacilli bacterium]|nr:hypothetical protein [Bacilli bacterium]
MRKSFILLILMGVFAFFPINAKAMLRVDENGNPIKEEIKEGEMTTLSEPTDTGTSNSSPGMSPEEKDRLFKKENLDNENVSSNDMPVSSDDDIINNDAKDLIKATGLDNAELYSENTTNDDNNFLYIILSSIAGLSLGSIGTYLLITKKR